MGTVFRDEINGLQVITAEHILRQEVRGSQIFKIKILRGEIEPKEFFATKIIKTSKDFAENQQDAVIFSLGSEPVEFAPYSVFNSQETAQPFWGDLDILGHKIPTLTSVLSEEKVNVLGFAKRVEGTHTSTFVIIDRGAMTGESGTGFIDSFDGLWVLHAESDPKDTLAIMEECWQLTGKRISGAATVSGPFGGKYH